MISHRRPRFAVSSVKTPIYFENGALDLRSPTKHIADGGVAFRDQSVALSQNRSADMHVEKDYDLGGVTLRLRGDTRLTGAGAHDARLGVGLYWSFGGQGSLGSYLAKRRAASCAK